MNSERGHGVVCNGICCCDLWIMEGFIRILSLRGYSKDIAVYLVGNNLTYHIDSSRHVGIPKT